MNQTPRGRFSLTWMILAIVIVQGIVGAFLGGSSNTAPFIVAIVVVLGLVTTGIVLARRGQQSRDSEKSAQRPFERSGSFSGNGAGRDSEQADALLSSNMSAIWITLGLFVLGGVSYLLLSLAGEGNASILVYILGGIVAIAIGVGTAIWSTRKK